MKKLTFSFMLITLLSSFYNSNTFKGTWEYAGGIYNGKSEDAPAAYSLHRKYDNEHYKAYVIEKGYKDEKYEEGDYILKADTCLETQTYSSQPSKVTGITIPYLYTLSNDTLTFKGTLPNGLRVIEYWKKVK